MEYKDSENAGLTPCPICDKLYQITEIEFHVNKCIFLNSSEAITEPLLDITKRKRTPSPLRNQSPSKKSKVGPTTSSYVEAEADKEVDLSFSTPLAQQLQPKTLSDFIGQDHILGKDTVLRALLEKCEIPSMILWGPPGSGKTSLAGAVRGICRRNPQRLRYASLCAATAGVKEVQAVVQAAKLQQKFGVRTVLFMDEIHRFNKKQQDVFLTHVERGDLVLIGATTENPSFVLNAALLSRCRVIVLDKLQPAVLYSILENAATRAHLEVGAGSGAKPTIERDALQWLADISDGDARIALGNLQLVLQYCNDFKERTIKVDDIRDKIKKSHMLYDRKGEEHYNIISAMHKSIRASDDNAALYWTTRMIVSGEDPRFIARRLVRAASEDIGNADPGALPLAVATMQGCQLLGMPEADVLLAQCAIYLARASKSREADEALANAKRVIKAADLQPSVPMHLRNAPTKLMKELGYGRRNGEEESNMPPGLENVDFF